MVQVSWQDDGLGLSFDPPVRACRGCGRECGQQEGWGAPVVEGAAAVPFVLSRQGQIVDLLLVTGPARASRAQTAGLCAERLRATTAIRRVRNGARLPVGAVCTDREPQSEVGPESVAPRPPLAVRDLPACVTLGIDRGARGHRGHTRQRARP